MNKSRIFALIIVSTMMIGVLSPFASAVTIPPSTQQMAIYPTFRWVLLTPSPNPTRQQWSQIITNNAQDLGIQAERVIMTWTNIYSRALQAPVSTRGLTYDQGGFDTLFVGYAMTPDPNPYPLFDGSQWSPTGQNYYYWNNSAANTLSRNITATFNTPARLASISAWQTVAYDDLPEITIAYTEETVAYAKSMDGAPFAVYHFPLWCPVEQWKYLNFTASGDKMVLAQTGPVGPPTGESLSPAHTTSYYDFTGIGSIFGEGGGGGLMIRNTSWFVIPYLMVPGSEVSSADHLFYNVTMRNDVYFQDGEKADARDLVATLRAYLSPVWGASIYSYYNSILGTDNLTLGVNSFGNYSVWYSGEQGTRGASWPLDYYKLGFAIPSAWVYFDGDILGTAYYPGHVLVNSSTYDWSGNAFIRPNTATLAAWTHTSFSNGVSGPYTYYLKNGTATSYTGPFSIGPYKFNGMDVANGIFKLTRWDGYFNTTALKAHGLMGVKDFWVQAIEGSTAAIAALHAGTVQILDSQYHLETTLSALDPSWSGYVQYVAWGVQELGFNMLHPIFGTGTGTPLGQAYPSRAAEAAKHVRHAVEWLVPKDYIIKNLLKGGSLGMTTAVLPQMPGFNTGITIRNATQADATYNAIQEFKAAGYNFVPVIPPSFWDTYGLLLSVVELAVVVVLAGFILYRLRAPVK